MFHKDTYKPVIPEGKIVTLSHILAFNQGYIWRWQRQKWAHFVAQGHGLYDLVWENNGMGYFGDLHKKISPPSTHKKIILVGLRFPSLLRAPK
jgi:hypothetical protein